MLDVDGLKERFNVKNTHTLGIPGSVSWLNMYDVLLVHAGTLEAADCLQAYEKYCVPVSRN